MHHIKILKEDLVYEKKNSCTFPLYGNGILNVSMWQNEKTIYRRIRRKHIMSNIKVTGLFSTGS